MQFDDDFARFHRNLPTIDQILNGNDEIELSYWVHELLKEQYYRTRADIVIKRLEEKNMEQFSQLNMLAFYKKTYQNRMETLLSEDVDSKTDKEVADWLQNHWYSVWSNRKQASWPNGIAEHTLKAVELLRKNYMRDLQMEARRNYEMSKEVGLKLVVNNDDKPDLEQPKLKTAGKGPTDNDWLSLMVCGTEFLVRKNGHEPWILAEFLHGGKKEGNVLLIPNRAYNNPKEWIWVDPIAFCRAFELRGILEVPEDDKFQG